MEPRDRPATLGEIGLKVLPEPMNGVEAIEALGDKLDLVARRNGMTPEKLRATMERDRSLWISPRGFIVYRDPAPPAPTDSPSPPTP
ncbi:hypothetical protein [Phytoactinopolyspora limicola]|uniref:hypothetical protein n=1 Tax=Phytoactinopolyspora limicola TaxID=2715536 RepID=UPI0014085121|nr:hypothetical protein [Phytoactinopolyspora limicola]